MANIAQQMPLNRTDNCANIFYADQRTYNNAKELAMKISVIQNSATHVIKFYSFVDKYGRHITSFYQVIKKPDTSLGAFNSLKRAQTVATRLTQSVSC